MNNFEFLASMAASKMYTKPSQEWRGGYKLEIICNRFCFSFGYSLEL